jgi:hypothetical protein
VDWLTTRARTASSGYEGFGGVWQVVAVVHPDSGIVGDEGDLVGVAVGPRPTAEASEVAWLTPDEVRERMSSAFDGHAEGGRGDTVDAKGATTMIGVHAPDLRLS